MYVCMYVCMYVYIHTYKAYIRAPCSQLLTRACFVYDCMLSLLDSILVIWLCVVPTYTT